MPNTQTAVFVESKMMQMISPSQDNPALPGTSNTPVNWGQAPLKKA